MRAEHNVHTSSINYISFIVLYFSLLSISWFYIHYWWLKQGRVCYTCVRECAHTCVRECKHGCVRKCSQRGVRVCEGVGACEREVVCECMSVHAYVRAREWVSVRACEYVSAVSEGVCACVCVCVWASMWDESECVCALIRHEEKWQPVKSHCHSLNTITCNSYHINLIFVLPFLL